MNSVEINSQQVLDLFARLTSKEQKKVYRQALNNAALILIRETRRNLRQQFGKKASRKDKYGNSLFSGVKKSVSRNAESVKIHLLGNFKLKFFEKGTASRQTSKGYNRGSITGTKFFEKAKQAKETEIFNNIDNYISAAIKKVAK